MSLEILADLAQKHREAGRIALAQVLEDEIRVRTK